jgi:LacI family transcriptional regulator
MATMKEVAENAEVSIATVSRVINDSGYVSPDLEERVREAMESLNYQPSSLARSLRRKETLTIGVLIPQLDHPFFSTLCFAIEKSLFAKGYRALICSAEEDRDKEHAYIEMLVRQRVDGVIIVPTGHSIENIRMLLSQRVPIIMVDRDMPEVDVSKVLTDNRHGGYVGTRYLLEQGHRNIGVIGTPSYSEPMHDRIRGVRAALNEYNIDARPDLMVTGTVQQFEMGYNTTRQFFQQPDPPSAIFALTDVIAIGVMHAAARAGLKLPGDLSIMGFDDIPMASYVIPTLTTVAQPIYEMGETAAELMLRHIQQKIPAETRNLKTTLHTRESTASLKPQHTDANNLQHP